MDTENKDCQVQTCHVCEKNIETCDSDLFKCSYCNNPLCDDCSNIEDDECVCDKKKNTYIMKMPKITNLYDLTKAVCKNKYNKKMERIEVTKEIAVKNIYEQEVEEWRDYEEFGDSESEGYDMRTTEQQAKDEKKGEEMIECYQKLKEEEDYRINEKIKNSLKKNAKQYTSLSISNFEKVVESMFKMINLFGHTDWNEATHRMVLDKLWEYILPQNCKIIPEYRMDSSENPSGSIDYVLVEKKKYFVFEVKRHITNGEELKKYITQIMIEMYSLTDDQNSTIGGCLYSYDRAIFFLFCFGQYFMIDDISLDLKSEFEFAMSFIKMVKKLQYYIEPWTLETISNDIHQK
eukprot:gene13107-8523_t